MDKRFLNKVVDQIVSETRIDYEYMGGRISIPIFPTYFPHPFSLSFSFFLKSFSNYFPHFSRHCEGVYGLNEDEVSYVWKEYRDIIIDEINNG